MSLCANLEILSSGVFCLSNYINTYVCMCIYNIFFYIINMYINDFLVIFIMINYFNIFTTNHFAFMFSRFKMLTHTIFIHNTSTLKNDVYYML